MPRKRRFFVPGVPVHIIQRGHSRDPVFFDDQNYATYAHWMRESSGLYNDPIHAFVFRPKKGSDPLNLILVG